MVRISTSDIGTAQVNAVSTCRSSPRVDVPCQGYLDTSDSMWDMKRGDVAGEARVPKDTTGLDGLSPKTHPARDAGGFRAIRSAMADVDTAEAALREAVRKARASGDSWAVIGAALGTSRQAAHERFGKDE